MAALAEHHPRNIPESADVALSSDIYRIAISLAGEIVDLSGFLSETDSIAHEELDRVGNVAKQARDVIQHVDEVRSGISNIAKEVVESRSSAEHSLSDLKSMTQHAKELANWVEAADGALASVEAALLRVVDANNKIETIAKQVTILAINARIEAARAGDAGAGFSVIAGEINKLAGETESAARVVSENVTNLANQIESLQSQAQESCETARSIRTGAEDSDARLDDIGSALIRASDGLGQISDHSTSLQSSTNQFENLTQGLRATFKDIAEGTQYSSSRIEHLIDGSEEILRLGVALGATVVDAPFLDFIQETADSIAQVFEHGLVDGQVTIEDLFDEDYRPIPGTNPEQFLTAFTEFTDARLPQLQETCFELDDRVIFCEAVDRTGPIR